MGVAIDEKGGTQKVVNPLDFSADVTTALANVIDGFTASLGAVIPITFGLAALVMVYHRVRGLIG